ncbi:hypothetical protein F2Q68_00010665 [Brassica cretica]|uniref:Uncharacterized protein n=1 Tax=Brassica cretica TaxID=69181 RepID=A0A8S9L293_BRACR|nr:hypothetical protein F2Q68_00010665 [Brassica cretica]
MVTPAPQEYSSEELQVISLDNIGMWMVHGLPQHISVTPGEVQTNPQWKVQPTDRLSLRVFKWTLKHRSISVWVTWMGSSSPPGVKPVSMTTVSMTIGPQGPNQAGYIIPSK